MKTKTLFTALLIAFVVASCVPTATIVSTEAPILTFTPSPTATTFSAPTSRLEPTATIRISSDYQTIATGNSLFIHNNGSTAAKDLTIWICVSQFFNGWQVLDNIYSLSVNPGDWASDFTQDHRRNDICPLPGKSQDNATVLKFASLASSQSIKIDFKPETNVKTFEQIYNGTVQIKFPISMATTFEPTEHYFSAMISTMAMEKIIGDLEAKMVVANLIIKTDCGNCLSEISQFKYFMAAKLFSNSCNQPVLSTLYSRISCQVRFEYYTPTQIPNSPIADDNIYLLAVHQEKQNYSFTDITKTEFDSDSP